MDLNRNRLFWLSFVPRSKWTYLAQSLGPFELTPTGRNSNSNDDAQPPEQPTMA